MSANTSIEWTDASWNPLRSVDVITAARGWHCLKVSPGCKNCYAEKINQRLGTGARYTPNPGVTSVIDDKAVELPLRWRKPRRIFVCSMTDLFGEWHTDEMIDRVFATMALADEHAFQVLTKRASRMLQWFVGAEERVSRAICQRSGQVGRDLLATRLPNGDLAADAVLVSAWPLRNVWLGVSVEDQERADERIPHLLATPASLRFISYEPALGPIKFSNVGKRSDAFKQLGKRDLAGIDWLIVGGESGPGARLCDIAWVRSTVDQCKAAGVACFVKQLGAKPFAIDGSLEAKNWAFCVGFMDDCGSIHLLDPKGGNPLEWPEWLRVRQFPAVTVLP